MKTPAASTRTDPSAGIVDYEVFAAESADVTTVADVDRVYRYVSPASVRVLGWKPADMEGRSQDDFVHPDDLPALREAAAALTDPNVTSTVQCRFMCGDGSARWTETTSRLVERDGAVVVVATVRDIADRQALMATLERQALTDPLTGVANRTVLMDRMDQGLRRLARTDGMLTVLYLDLDRFKVINDSLGHGVGDTLLIQMAQRLGLHLRPMDTLARLGGDEFVIVAEGVADQQAAIELCDRIIEASRQPFRLGDEDFVCTVSVGIACTSDSQSAADDLLREADLALYRAKARGRDRSEVFDEDQRRAAVDRLSTERVLRRSIDSGHLVVEYQPIIDLHLGRFVGGEALLRIRDPERGLLQPRSFLAVAEETGLLVAMDEYVLADAVKHASAWRARAGDHVSVGINVTARHLADAGFRQAVLDELVIHALPPGNLHVELTERVLMDASQSMMSGLRALRDAGVQVGLDEFGIGYSSLGFLREFPLDFVKIDQSFIHALERDRAGRSIVAAVIELSHALDLTVIAVGVETVGQLRVLETLECDRAQGFLFAPSGTPDMVGEFVADMTRPTALIGQP